MQQSCLSDSPQPAEPHFSSHVNKRQLLSGIVYLRILLSLLSFVALANCLMAAWNGARTVCNNCHNAVKPLSLPMDLANANLQT